ncbi:MAG: GAF domain-containing protein, partial [Armatimonadetes bacterium]|nr:GAF domain-containing protein [Armatimonadota bacterium]
VPPQEAAAIAELRAELDEKSTEVELLHEVLRGVAAASDTDGMLRFIAEVANRVTGADSASIYVFDQARQNLVLRAVAHAPHGVVGRLVLQIGEGITGWVAREMLPVALERNASSDPRFKTLPDLQDQECESFLSVPMTAHNIFIGVLNVKTREPRRYEPRTIRLLQSVATQAATAVEGMRLQESMRDQATQLSALSEVSKTITSNLYLEEILQLIVAMTARTFQFKICSIMLLDEERQELVIKATQSKSRDYVSKPNLKVGESVAGKAVQTGEAFQILDVQRAPEYQFPDIAEKEGLRSMVCVPLVSRERSIGVLNCYSGQPKVFSREEIASLRALANQAALAIENAKLMVRSAIIQEMHHRVKNSLQTVASLLRLQVNRPHPGTPEEMLKESINRIISIAAVHDLLSREELDQVNLREVAQTILTLTGKSLLRPGQQIRMRVRGGDVMVPASKASTLALILNELVQNAVEHGFSTRDEGEIDVAIRQEERQVTLEVTNNGTPLPPEFDIRKSRSLGLEIIASLAQNDLGGRFFLRGEELTRG